jgi:hypothetical protein
MGTVLFKMFLIYILWKGLHWLGIWLKVLPSNNISVIVEIALICALALVLTICETILERRRKNEN